MDEDMDHEDTVVGGDIPAFGAWRAIVSYCLAGLCLAVFVATVVFLTAVLRTRKFTYNLYIVFLLFPDAFLNLILGIRSLYDGLLNDHPERMVPASICRLQQVGIGFYISNLYINMMVSKSIYELVWNSYRRKKTKPPTIRGIVRQVVIIYGLVGIFATWQVLPVDWAEKDFVNDPYCNATTNLPQWAFLLVFGLIVPPPVFYVLLVFHRIRAGKLLPLTGRTRVLAMYFLRIFGLFIGFYTPMTIVLTMYSNADESTYHTPKHFLLQSIFTLMNPIQNIASMIVFSQKDDIQKTLAKLKCRLSSVMGFTMSDLSQLTTYSSSARRTTTASTATAKKKTRKSVWKQDDTYEKKDGSGNLVKVHYKDHHLDHPLQDGDDDEDGEAMAMWMSMPFSETTISKLSASDLHQQRIWTSTVTEHNENDSPIAVERRDSWSGPASEAPEPNTRRTSWPSNAHPVTEEVEINDLEQASMFLSETEPRSSPKRHSPQISWPFSLTPKRRKIPSPSDPTNETTVAKSSWF